MGMAPALVGDGKCLGYASVKLLKIPNRGSCIYEISV